MMSLNSADVYCGPPSETMMFGTPSLVKTAFISRTKILDVMLHFVYSIVSKIQDFESL